MLTIISSEGQRSKVNVHWRMMAVIVNITMFHFKFSTCLFHFYLFLQYISCIIQLDYIYLYLKFEDTNRYQKLYLEKGQKKQCQSEKNHGNQKKPLQ